MIDSAPPTQPVPQRAAALVVESRRPDAGPRRVLLQPIEAIDFYPRPPPPEGALE